MQINGNNFTSIEQVTGQYLKQKPERQTGVQKDGLSFLEVLQQTRLQSQDASPILKFSKHAGERLADRNISLNEEQLKRLEDGASKASAKGIKESLVLMDNLAFIVNTRNYTVITAMSQQGEEEKIFTNIDGAVLV